MISFRRTFIAVLAWLSFASMVDAQMIVAHRGASHDAPENTLSAFRLAWQQNADGIEGDFYLTADDHIVCIHDADTRRTAGVKKPVETSTLAELRSLEYGRWKNASFDGEPIPTLDDVIETVPDGKTIVIELKSDASIVPRLIETIDRFQNEPIRFLVIAFDADTVAMIKKQRPKQRVHWLTGFKQSTPSAPFHPTADEIVSTISRIGADGVGMQANRDVIDAAFVATMKQGGCGEFHVWTVDAVADAKYFADLGSIGITTNVPAVIGEGLR
ncbi:putative glycerophosphoryl diester phosphodiesterase 1 [Rubripirellula tenax]|uniref:Putative glycerophosphoryl diester phosphodiesterase 1 n=1 Tax=Rubripirellula tenax TaxID=2528015 RepID=A0A5C6FG10_9BACT|nr:glycerophosphodiester phosphodiesterase [Rubripirellula tenax]TWU60368.1 putative glycerophosphoryl diester phosphodiesterase 1 [Rubripirellula tenax]